MRIARGFLVVALLAIAGLPARADLIMPGQKGVAHEIVVKADVDLGDVTLVAYPVSFGDPWAVIQPGVPFTFYKHLQPKIYAIRGPLPPKDRAQAETWFDDTTIPRSDLSLRITSTVDLHDPTERIRTVYRITAIHGTRLLVEKGADERFDSDGAAMSEAKAAAWTVAKKTGSLGGIVAFGVLGIVLLRRRRAREAAEARS